MAPITHINLVIRQLAYVESVKLDAHNDRPTLPLRLNIELGVAKTLRVTKKGQTKANRRVEEESLTLCR
jgi:hypothetical protein